MKLKRTVLALLCVVLVACEEDPIEPKPAPAKQPGSEVELIEAFERAYQDQDPDRLATLLCNDPDASYLFFPSHSEDEPWGYTEEVRIHRRMFTPESPGVGESPLPLEIWLDALTINLAPVSPFMERPDFYASDTNPDGLDPKRWRVTDAQYGFDALFDLRGETDYLISTEVNFVVANDLMKAQGQAGKFCIFVCEELGSTSSKTGAATF